MSENSYPNPIDKSPSTISSMFDRVAHRYNLLNTLMTGGMHYWWRWKSIKKFQHYGTALDLCTGTGDYAFLLAPKAASVMAIDFSEKMLSMARAKVKDGNITFKQGDALHLEFPPNHFDFITIGFGVRNFANLHQGLKEAFRVLSPGGTLIILETGQSTGVWRIIQKIHESIWVPLVTRLFCGDTNAYQYLLKSTAQFPSGQTMVTELQHCGFKVTSMQPQCGGAAWIYEMQKGNIA